VRLRDRPRCKEDQSSVGVAYRRDDDRHVGRPLFDSPGRSPMPRSASRFSGRLAGQFREKSPARLLTPATAFRADPAVLVVWRMTLAFVSGDTAGRHASFDRGAKNADIGGGLPCRNARGRRADVAAVETEAYAADQVLDVGLGERRIRTARTGIRTVRALGNAANERGPINTRRLRMRLDDLSNCHVCSFFRATRSLCRKAQVAPARATVSTARVRYHTTRPRETYRAA
jgi:hypothetical protein